MLFKELIEQIKELIEQIDEICQIRQIRQRVEDLSGKRKELCRRSFMIQSEEIKNDIIELRKNLVNKKRKIKNKQKGIEKEVNKLEKDLNGLVLSDSKLYKKSYLENLYFISAIVLGSIPIMSLLGFVLLFFYLKNINASIYFLEIASSGGIWFSFVTGAVIFIFFFLCPIVILGIEDSNKKNSIGLKLLDNVIVIVLFVFSPIFSFIGFSYFFDNYEDFILVLLLIWHVIILLMFFLYKTNSINLNTSFGFLAIFWFMMMSISLSLFSRISDDYPLKNVFKIIGFSQKNYSWFKVNKSYFDRTGLTVSDIKFKEKEFTDDKADTYSFSSDGKSVFLYGNLWVNSTNVKILCSPRFGPVWESGKLIVDVKKKCIKFQSGDLQNMDGLTELIYKDKKELVE